jgi:SnoaL-like domain
LTIQPKENALTEIEKLIAVEDIKRLKARYFRCVDTKDWDGWRNVFAHDVHIDISEDVPDGVFTGADALIESASASLIGCVSVHHGHCPEIDITSPTNASGIWPMEDILRWSANSAYPNQSAHGYGHYFETYEKLEGQWRITSMKLRRLRVDFSTTS